MPELPDIEAYIEALRPRVCGQKLLGIRLANPFLLRTVDPPLAAIVGARIEGVRRLGKRLVFEAVAPSPESIAPIFIVIHLMIAGRLRWQQLGSSIPKGSGLAALDFASGSLILIEAGKKRRASLRLVTGGEGLAELDPGGLELIGSSLEEFYAVLRSKNRTLKRALTDPHMFSGIGNAYSDEILHEARLSPLKLSQDLSPEEITALHAAAVEVLETWTERLRGEAREAFPEKVTAFRDEMAVHGRFGSTCPECGTAVQRIVYADNECDYCPGCQTNGRILADRALSRLLKDDWPRKASPGWTKGRSDGGERDSG